MIESKIPPTAISVLSEGVQVEGVVTFACESDVWVEITNPYQGVSSGWHTPYFAMGDRSRWYVLDGKLTERGLETSERTLRDIYHGCKYFEANAIPLSQAYGALLQKETLTEEYKDSIDQATFNEARKSLRWRLKNSEISSKEYQERLGALKKRYEYRTFTAPMKIIWDFIDAIKQDSPVLGIDTIPQLISEFLVIQNDQEPKRSVVSRRKERMKRIDLIKRKSGK